MTDDPGVPLHHYRQHNADVELTCCGCMDRRTLKLEAVIARLKERGLGDENTGIREVARFVTEPCACGAVNYESRPDFPRAVNTPRGHV
jgi:hypothetical protein